MRLQTLPLSLSGIILGTAIAYRYGSSDILIFVLSVVIALILQLISNFANDLGDGLKGTDDKRIGPIRVIGKGLMNKRQLTKGIFIAICLVLLLIFILLSIIFNHIQRIYFWSLLFLGILSIIAALSYTLGKKPYGYLALGDLAVFIFFGPVAVMGSFVLYGHSLNHMLLFPSVSIGLFCVSVLNLNNMRDIKTDSENNKKTLAVIFGISTAKLYHMNLILGAMVFLMAYSILKIDFIWYKVIYIVFYPFLITHLLRIRKAKDSVDFIPELKKVSLLIFFISICFSIGQIY